MVRPTVAAVPTIIVHGGAGDVRPTAHAAHVEGCRRAAESALSTLVEHRDPMRAALAAVEALEMNPIFNAGTGACLNEAGNLELDASVMLGQDLSFGGVACLPAFEHPIAIAEAVRRDGQHALLASEGATLFAKRAGFTPARPGDMITEAARERLERVRAGDPEVGWAGNTVGAVAIDASGRLAAATSTGGTVGKAAGRIGDTPLPGAGTYADDSSGACSTTGIGEEIMRYLLARHGCELLARGASAQAAADEAIRGFGERIGGRGGLILLDRQGRVGLAKNTKTMSYAVASLAAETRCGI